MPELSNANFEVMRTIAGAKFYGHLTSASAINTKEKAPYRVLYARRPTFIRAGDTILTRGTEVVILMEHPDDFDWAQSFKAVYALEKLPWTRQIKIIDPVSKVEKNAGEQNMGTIYVNFDTPEEVNFLGMLDTKYRFITGQDVRVGDEIGDSTLKLTVKRIVHALGVKVVFAS